MEEKKQTKTFKQLWLQEQFKKIREVYSQDEVSNEEIKNILLKKYSERRISEGRLYNNLDKKNYFMNQEQFINYYLNMPYILSGYATFYKNQNDSISIGSEALKCLLENRQIYKKRMKNSEYGSAEYVYNKILQLSFKVLANSYYGILGEKNSIFYNPFVQNSITMTGQDLITTSIVASEQFLSDNINFNDVDAVLLFILNVKSEKYSDNILEYIDYPKSKEDLYNYFISKTTNLRGGEEIILKAVERLTEEEVNRVYYKNKILELCGNEYFSKKLGNMLKYNYEESPDAKMVDDLNDIKEKIIEFCFYDHLCEDRYKRSIKDTRKSIIVVDTDSNFIDLNKYINTISKQFNLDKSDNKKMMTIFNIFMNIITDVLKKLFWTLTNNMNIIDNAKPIINMKPEFVYKRILLTKNKKSYGGLITAQLGKLLPKPDLDIKGLSIRKSSMSKKLRREFTEILQNDILTADKINLKSIIQKYDDIGDEIIRSLKAGETFYLLPKNLELIEGYKEPSTIEPVRGAIIWNALEPENQISPPEKVNLIKLNCYDKNDLRLKNLEATHPDKYAAIMKTVFNEGVANPAVDISRFGFAQIAIPKSIEKIPDYLLEFIDYESMLNNNMSNGYILLESLGIYCDDVQTTRYKSNIIEI